MSDPQNTFRTHVRTLGDTRTAIGCILTQGGKPVDVGSLTVNVIIEKDNGTAEQASTSTGVTKQNPYSVTLDTTNNWVALNGHPFENGQQIVFGGTLTSTGLSSSNRYFVREAEDNSFKVSLTRNGTPITLGATGSSVTAYIVGSVSYDFSSANVNEAGYYWLWWQIVDGSAEEDTFPHDGKKLRVEVVDPGF